ncbi:MAG: methyltransferase [Solirubrobacteraceae bacterium]
MSDETDILAAIYERAVTPRNRRRLGTFFTSPILVEHMLSTGERLIGCTPDVVVDPGAGVGAFSLAAARRWPKARVIAVDVNVVTLGLLAARLDHAGLSDRAELVLGDFIGWLSRRRRAAESVWLTLGNPPFTRSQSLDAETKHEAAEAAGEMVVSGHATLSTLFAAAATRQLEPQDAMALVLPAAWTYTRSAKELRAGLWNQRHRALELHRWPTSARAFTGPSVTATVVGMGSRQSAPQMFVHGVARVQDGCVVVSERQSIRREGPCPNPLPGGAGRRTVGQSDQSCRLEEVFRARRGVATGANSFFFLTDEEAKQLPDRATRPGVCTLRGTPMSQTVLDRDAWLALGRARARCHLLDIDEELVRDPAVAALLLRGRQGGLHNRYLCRQREPWYVLEEMEVPDAFLSPLVTDQGLRIVVNDVGAIPSNSLYGLFLQDGVKREVGDRVIAWLRSDVGVATLRGHGRQFAGGSIKLEPRELRTLPIPAELLTPKWSPTGSFDVSPELAVVAAYYGGRLIGRVRAMPHT